MDNAYLHNFGCWAAARSIQNPKLKNTQTEKIRFALEKIDIQQYLSNPGLLQDFSKTNDKLIVKLVKALNWDKKTKYGVAAKIIAIYFKVTLVIGQNAPKKIIDKIYPPFDSFNLKSLGLKKLRWTNMGETEFKEAIKMLDKHCKEMKMNYVDFEAKNTFTN
jgi:hypothetical protein